MYTELCEIPGYHTWTVIKPITEGWSFDKKYYVELGDGQRRLIRLSAVKHAEKKKKEFELLTGMKHLNLNISKPVSFGICDQGNHVYMIFTWIEGEPAEIIVPRLPNDKQYELGYRAGEMLRRIHSIPIPKFTSDWQTRFNAKIDRKIKMYYECNVKFENADKIIKYIEANRYLLSDRPQTLNHGDYHIGNMVIDKAYNLGVIDFNRLDIGDPWEEFNRIVWCSSLSKYFATGRIDGYFNGEVPEVFFRLLALYIGSNQLGSIPWAIPFGEQEVQTMIDQAQLVMESYSEYSTFIPKWYLGASK